MIVYLTDLKELTKSLYKNRQDMEHFRANYKSVSFDVVYDISHAPFDLMIGAIGYQWGCVLKLQPGFATEMNSHDFHALCEMLNLQPGKGRFLSSDFLKAIASQSPNECHPRIVPLNIMRRFRHQNPDNDGRVRDKFFGWNDHKTDHNKARNFDVTEKYFGKQVADFCRRNNISSRWTYSDDEEETELTYPPEYTVERNSEQD